MALYIFWGRTTLTHYNYEQMGQFRAISSLKDTFSHAKKGRYDNISCQPMPFNNNHGKDSHYASVEKDLITVKIGALPCFPGKIGKRPY